MKTKTLFVLITILILPSDLYYNLYMYAISEYVIFTMIINKINVFTIQEGLLHVHI